VSPERLAELKAIIADATPGPWVSLFRAVRITPRHGPPFDMFVGDEDDADFIVAASEEFGNCLAEIARLQRIEVCVKSIAQNVHGALREDLDDALRGMAADV
jgi:hypothetical protein